MSIQTTLARFFTIQFLKFQYSFYIVSADIIIGSEIPKCIRHKLADKEARPGPNIYIYVFLFKLHICIYIYMSVSSTAPLSKPSSRQGSRNLLRNLPGLWVQGEPAI